MAFGGAAARAGLAMKVARAAKTIKNRIVLVLFFPIFEPSFS
jgi:hypothetical protein